MIQCDCNIIVVSRIQLLVSKTSFIYYFFDLIVNKYEINNIPKCTPLWHEMFEIASVSGAPPPTPLGSLRRSPDSLVGSGFFAFNMSHYLKSLKICPASTLELNQGRSHKKIEFWLSEGVLVCS